MGSIDLSAATWGEPLPATPVDAPSFFRLRARAYWRNPASRLGLPVALAIAAMACVPSAWLPYDPVLINLGEAKQPGFWAGDYRHALGTDFLGRDLVSRMIHAARLTLVAVLAFASWSTMARVVRAQTLSARQEPYVEAARALGVPTAGILRRHVLPNVLSPLLAVATYEVSRLVLTESALSFLGLGVSPPAVTWGGMIGDGRNFIYDAWWTAAVPGLMIAVLVFALNFVGDGLRDAFDPTSWREGP